MYKLTRAALAAATLCVTGLAEARHPLKNLDLSGSRGASSAQLASQRARAKAIDAKGGRVELDERRGVPTFFVAPPDARSNAQFRSKFVVRPEATARGHLKQLADLYGLRATDVDAAELREYHDLGDGPIIVSFGQRVGGIEVFRTEAKVLMDQGQALHAISGHLVPGARLARAASARFALSGEDAITLAFEQLTGVRLEPGDLTAAAPEDAFGYTRLTLAGAKGGRELPRPARFKKVFFDLGDVVEPAYYLELEVSREGARSSDLFGYVISARDGRTLFRKNLAEETPYSYRVWADPTYPHIPMDGPQGNAPTPHPTGIPDGYQAPWVPSNLLSNIDFVKPTPTSTFADPWIPGGAANAVTQGNNVDAYADIDGRNGFQRNDVRADATNFTFDYTFDPTIAPTSETQRKAAIVQLFYVNNFLHDWFYDAGFNEASGNAQSNNYGRGGQGTDELLAEAQDYSGVDNANMQTPADGASPRMQMYLFTGNGGATLRVTAPAALAGDVGAGAAGYGPQTFDTGTAKAVVLVTDGAGTDVNDGCEAFTNAAQINGRIALLNRGTCDFDIKTKNAQNAGAVAVLIANNRDGALEGMGGDDTTITIGTLGITQAYGNTLKAELAAGNTVSASAIRVAVPQRDGTIDNQIVAHEWGHYISNRLIGNGSGLNNNQGRSMGEGWGDFHALLMTVRESDTANPTNTTFNGVYGLAGYVMSGGVNNGYYYGIRRVPYSTDLNKNGLTFRHITDYETLPANVLGAPASNSEVHNSGEVWATMLWECYAGILRDTVGSSPRLSFDEANRRMREYLVAGYKLTPSSPTFVQARDALLSAIQTRDTVDYERCYAGFAKRGLGAGAIAPPAGSTDHRGVTESYFVEVAYESASLSEATPTCDADGLLDGNEGGTLSVTLRNTGTSTLSGPQVDVSSASGGITFPAGTTITFPSLAPGVTATADLAIAATAMSGIQPVRFDLQISDATMTNTYQASYSTRINLDALPGASRVDDVESGNQGWTVGGSSTTDRWQLAATSDFEHSWKNGGSAVSNDQWLTSPALTVGAANPTITITHRHRFEEVAGNGGQISYYDGGVLECELNGNGTWNAVDDTNYTPPTSRTLANGNPLSGRRAFAGMSAGYPAYTAQTFTAPNTCRNGTVRFRFRVASDNGTQYAGWDIASIEVGGGVTNNPFVLVTPDDGAGCTVVNEPPTASAGSDQSVSERATVQLSGSGTDQNGDALNYSWSAPAGIVLNPSAGVAAPTFTAPDVAVATPYTFTLTVTDPSGASDSDSVVITVNPQNRAPIANAGPDQTVNERATVQLAGSGTDPDSGAPDNDSIVAYAWTAPAGLSLSSASIANPTFTAPDVAAQTSYDLTVTVTDESGATGSDTVRITVNAQNRAPSADAGADQTVTERALVQLAGAGSDPDSGAPDHDSIVAFAWAAPAGLSLSSSSIANPTFTAPDVASQTTYDLTLTVTDESGATGSDTVRITVNAQNRPPVVDAGADQTVDERAIVQLVAIATDPDGGAPDNDSVQSYAWTAPAGVTLSDAAIANPSFTAPDVATQTAYDLSVTVTDRFGATATDTVRVTVNPKNRAPIANAGADQSVNERSAVQLSGSGSDPDAGAPDNDAIASYAWTAPAGITLSDAAIANPTFTAPDVAAQTAFDLTLTVTDGSGATASDTVRVTVNPVNRAPTADAGVDQTVDERTAVQLSGGGSDPDSGAPDDDSIVAFAWTVPAGVSLSDTTIANPKFTAPDVSAQATFDLTLTVTDEAGATGVDTVRVTVNPVNRPPVANAGSDLAVDERATVQLSGSGSDPDSGAPDDDTIASFTWTAPTGVTLSNAALANPTFTAPDVATVTTLTLTLTVTDRSGATGSDSVQVTVNPKNRPPVANAGSDFLAIERSTVQLNGSASDPDSGAPDLDTIASYAWSAPAGIVLSNAAIANPTFTAPDVSGDTPFTFTLTVSDATGATASDSVTVTVRNENRAPTVSAGDDFEVDELATAQLDATGADLDGDFLLYEWTQLDGPAVTIDLPTSASTTFTAPDVTTNTTLTFEVTVTDSLATATDTVVVTVKALNSAPTADAGADQVVDERSAVTLDGTASSDPDGDGLTYEWTQTGGPTVALTGANTAQPTFTAPDVTAPQTLTFALTVRDPSNAASAPDEVTITVGNVNRRPTARVGADQTVQSGATVTLDGSASDDEDGDALTYTWTQTSGPTVMLDDAAAVSPTFTAPAVTTTTTITFALEVHDEALASDPATVTITVTAASGPGVGDPETPEPDPVTGKPSSCGCGATTDAGQLFGLLPVLALAAARFRRRKEE